MSRLYCQEHTRRPLPTVSRGPVAEKALSDLHTVPEVLKAAEESINTVIEDVSKLSQAASKLPYYKFNNMWSRQMQGAVGLLLTQH